MPEATTADPRDPLVAALRAAGCVFAEEEARILREAAAGIPADGPGGSALDRLVRARIDGAPLEQLVGRVAFGDLVLHAGADVFIPRQRTLQLAALAALAVEAAARAQDGALADGRDGIVVEAFCGIGPVAATIAHRVPGVRVHAVDIDERALALARTNIPAGGVHRADVLDGLPADLRGAVDVIAAVPPYVPDGEAEFLPREARDHEPGRALFGGADGLDPARSLRAQAVRWLRPGGVLLMEMGLDQADALAREAAGAGWQVRIHRGEDGRTGVLECRLSV